MGIMSALSVAVATYSAGASFITAAGVFFGQLGFFGRLVLGIAGSAILRALAPKPSAPKVTGYTLTATGAALNHQVVYGKIRVAGAEVFKATTGSDNKFLHLVLAFTGHEIESFDEIWINDRKATLDGNGNVTTVTDEEGNTSDVYNGKLTIIKRLGGSDNDTPPEFGSSPNRPSDAGWTPEHTLTNISYLYCRLKFDRDAFPNGVPEIQATVKGKKVYNPITAVTEWSDNPALCLRDYLTNSTYGLGEDADNIDDDLIETAYNACNEAGVVTETKTIWSQSYTIGSKKFTCNGAFTTDSKPVDILEDMLTSMGGAMWYAQGKWRMRASKYTAPTITFDEDDLRSGVSVSTRHSTRDNFNIVKGVFRGIESNYIDTDYPEVRNVTEADSLVVGEKYTITKLGDTNWNTVAGTSGQTYNVGDLITVDAVGSGTGTADFNVGTDNGVRSPIDMALPFTSDSVTARRIARIALERHRQQLSVSATFGMRAFNVQVGDTVSLTNSRFGWSAKEFEVLSWILVVGEDLSVNVQMDLRETAASTFDEVDDAVVYERDNSTLFSPFEVPTVTVNAPTIGTSVNKDGSVITHADFTWSSSDDSRISYYLFEYSFDGSNYNNVRLDGTRYRLTPLVSGQTYYYRVTPYNYLGVQGTPVDGATGVLPTDDDTTPNAPTGVSVVAEYRTATVSWTEPTTNTDGSDFTDLKHYEVYRGTSTNPTTLVARVAASKFTDGGLADNTTYYYRVKAVDRSNNPSSFSATDSDTTNPELTDGVDGIDGADGDDGNSVALLSVYKRASSAPATPTGGSFNFGTTTLTAPSGWSATPPSGSDPLYISNATASVQGVTGTDSNLTWSQPEVFAENGQDGNAGKSVYTAIVFNRYASAPSTPTGGSFNFGTNTLTPPTGWLLDVPSGSNPAYGTRAVFSITGDTGTDSSATWSTPFKIAEDGIDGLDGAEGADGLSTFLASVFLRSASAPSTPTGGSYNFGTNTLTAPSGWNTSAPSGSNPLYVSTALASVQGVTGTDSSLTWTAPVILAQDGADGEDGTDGADGEDGDTGDTVVTGKVYYTTLQSSAPSTPSATSFNTGTGLFTGLTSGWSRTQPSVEITDTTVLEWSSDFVVTISGIDSSQTITFTSPSSAIQVTTDLESDNYSAGSSGWHLERDTGDIEVNEGTFRGDVLIGDLAVGADMTPTSGSGARIEADGDVAFGDYEKYVRYDVSSGELEIRGEVINFKDSFFNGNEGTWGQINVSQADLSNILDGAGIYVFAVVGNGGAGGQSYHSDNNNRGGTGGGGGGVAIVGYEWDGNTALACTISKDDGNVNNNFNNFALGNRGGSMTMSVGGSTVLTVTGGQAGGRANAEGALTGNGGDGGVVSGNWVNDNNLVNGYFQDGGTGGRAGRDDDGDHSRGAGGGAVDIGQIVQNNNTYTTANGLYGGDGYSNNNSNNLYSGGGASIWGHGLGGNAGNAQRSANNVVAGAGISAGANYFGQAPASIYGGAPRNSDSAGQTGGVFSGGSGGWGDTETLNVDNPTRTSRGGHGGQWGGGAGGGSARGGSTDDSGASSGGDGGTGVILWYKL